MNVDTAASKSSQKRIIQTPMSATQCAFAFLYGLLFIVDLYPIKFLWFLSINPLSNFYNNRMNLVYILIPLITVVMSFYISEINRVIIAYGYKTVRSAIPDSHKRLFADVLTYMVASLIMVISEGRSFIVLYAIHSFYMMFVLARSIIQLKNDIMSSFVVYKTDEIVKLIGYNTTEFSTKEFLIIGKASVFTGNDTLFYCVTDSYVRIISTLLEDRNRIISALGSTEAFSECLDKLYKHLITLSDIAYHAEIPLSGQSISKVLSRPLLQSYRYGNISEFSDMSKLLNGKFVVKQYISKESVDSRIVIDVYRYVFNELFDRDLSMDWIKSTNDIIQEILFFVAISNSNSIKSALLLLLSTSLESKGSNKIECYKMLCENFFNLSRLASKQNSSEWNFNNIVIGGHFKYLMDNKLIEQGDLFISEYFDYLYYCLFNSLERTYHEHLKMLENLASECCSSSSKCSSSFRAKLQLLVMDDFRLIKDKNFAVAIAKLYMNEIQLSKYTEDYHSTYYNLFMLSSSNENFGLTYYILQSYNDAFEVLKRHETQKQESFIDGYASFLKYSARKRNSQLFQLVFSEYSNITCSIDKEKNFANSTVKKLLTEYQNIASYCLEINEADFCHSIVTEIQENIIEFNGVSTHDDRIEVVRSMLEIGIRAIEYESSVIIKAISNSIGWTVQKQCFEKRSNDLFKYSIQSLSQLYNLTSSMLDSLSTTAFIGTAFIILGGLSETKPEYHQMNQLLVSESKKLPKPELMKNAYHLRRNYVNSWTSIMAEPDKHIDKFYKKLLI